MKKAFESLKTGFTKGSGKKGYYPVFTLAFLIAAFLCFSFFIFSGRSLIWDPDGWNQHFKALVYYSRYLRDIIRHLVSGDGLVIPDWDFYIGEGNDIIGTLHYYVIGDPVAFLSVFVPVSFMPYFYSLANILRIYLAGIAFSELCFNTGEREPDRFGILAGALTYMFSGWAFFGAGFHPYFLNPMIYLPMVILGVENIIRKKKPALFMISVAISALSNFYFFYMIVIITAVYVLLRLILLYHKDIRSLFLNLVSIGAYSLTGLCMAGILLLPVLYSILSDSRMSFHRSCPLFYPLSYYESLPAILISNLNSFDLWLGLSAPAILAVFLLFGRKKKDLLLKLLFIAGLMVILFPFGAKFLNGMSYSANRWCFAFVLLCAFILQREWDGLLSARKEDFKYLLVCSGVYYLILALSAGSRLAGPLSAVVLLFVTLAVIWIDPLSKRGQSVSGDNKTVMLRRQVIILCVIIFGIFNNAYSEFSLSQGWSFSDYYTYKGIPKKWEDNEASAVKALSDVPYPRYTGSSVTGNVNLVNKISNTQYYWSMSNPYINDYRNSLAMRESVPYNYTGYDDRSTPISLSGCDLFVVKDDGTGWTVPFGFEYLTDLPGKGNYKVFKNAYSLPTTGYCYDSCITKEIWENLNPVQKQEIGLDAAYVEKPGDMDPVTADDLSQDGSISLYDRDMSDYEVSYDMELSGDEITLTGSGFVLTGAATLSLDLHDVPDHSELYVGFEGLEFKHTEPLELYFGGEDVDPKDLFNPDDFKALSREMKIHTVKSLLNHWKPTINPVISVSDDYLKKTIEYLQPESSYSGGRHDFIANLGYLDDQVDTVYINPDLTGIYTFDSLNVYAVPKEDYGEKIMALKTETVSDVMIGTDTLSGEIELIKPKLLCLAVPYSKGWKAYVDDIETETLCVNGHYTGMAVPEGKHRVRIDYRTPLKREGAVLSLLGIMVFAGILFYTGKKAGHRT
ncbi:MAG: YfhO family protein [Lachnospiraceae bacterium]|nr:YfhO family protein [Lachnospiraceae bacterium]